MNYSEPESELTDLSDDDSEGQTSTPFFDKTQVTKSGNVKGPSIPRLRQPHLEPLAVENIYSQLKDNLINLSPEYQRSVVWDDAKQGSLIDSLIHNYVVFPLVFAECVLDDGQLLKVCIDGKQRITAIQRFMEGVIPYRDSQTNKDTWFEKVPKGRKGVTLSTGQRQRFRQVPVSTAKYDTIDENDEREIFQRVQNGVALSSHERLRAFNGPYADLLRSTYEKTTFFVRQFLAFEKSKGRDFFMLGQILLTINHRLIKAKGDFPRCEVTISRVETMLRKKESPTPGLQNAIEGVVDTLNCLVHDEELQVPFVNMNPTSFVMTGLLIYLHRNSLSLAQIADAVRLMKQAGKAKSGASSYKAMGEFVTKGVKAMKSKADGTVSASSVRFDPPKSINGAPPHASGHLLKKTLHSLFRTQKNEANKARKRKRDEDGQQVQSDSEANTRRSKHKAQATCCPRESSICSSDDAHIAKAFPSRKPANLRTPISKTAIVKGATLGSKATTKARRKSTAIAVSSAKDEVSTPYDSVAGDKETKQHFAKPRIPTSSRNATTTRVSPSSFPRAPDEQQQKTALSSASILASSAQTPPPSTAPVTPSSPQLSEPIPRQVSQPRNSRPSTPVQSPLDHNKPNIKPSPTSSAAPLTSSTIRRIDRLAPLRAAKLSIAENLQPQPSFPTPSSTSPTPTFDPRRLLPPNVLPSTPKHSEAAFQTKFDETVNTSSPNVPVVPSLRNTPSSSPRTESQSQKPAIALPAPAPGDTTSRTGDTNEKAKDTLNDTPIIGPLVPAARQKRPPFTFFKRTSSNDKRCGTIAPTSVNKPAPNPDFFTQRVITKAPSTNDHGRSSTLRNLSSHVADSDKRPHLPGEKGKPSQRC